jgi:predicted NBD/HSP70 family sugar kinase
VIGVAARTTAQATLLRAVHGQPGVTRAALAQELGMPSGFAAETVARLVTARLLSEEPAPPTGSRGRPTTLLRAHPDGPLAAVATITQETWTVAAAELGGTRLAAVSGDHDRDQGRVLAAVKTQLGELAARFGTRIRAAAVSVPGTVVGSQLVSAPNLGWHEVDLSGLWPHYHPELPLIVGNDATCAAVAESRHGAGAGAGTMVYLYLGAGIGGAVVEGNRVVTGATGTAGEFGHMPFGDPARRCRCGAMGCWNTTLDGDALARALGQQAPADEISFLRRLLAAARAREPRAASAIQDLARSVGRGVAGLVNALDPHLVVVGGLGPELLEVAGGHALAAYHDGLMAFRTLPPPPLLAAHLPDDDGSLLGAAELCFDRILTEEGLQAWALADCPA